MTGPRHYDRKDKRILYALALAVFVCGAGVYANSINGDFIKDDIYQVLRNEWIRSFSNIGSVFVKPVWGFMEEGGEQVYYRPMMHLFYMVSYKFSGLETWGYHLVNILLHAINSALVFLLTIRIFDSFKEGEEKSGWSYLPPFFAALIFATHTINTEVVDWVAAVPEISFTFFSLLSFLFYISGSRRARVVSVLLFIPAIFCKETAIIVPAIIFAYSLLLIRERFTALLIRFIPYGAVVVFYLIMRMVAMGGGLTPVEGVEVDAELSAFQLALNMMPLIATYFEKLILPIELAYFSHMRFELLLSPFELRAIIYILSTAFFIYFLYRLYRARSPYLFIIVWIMTPLAPVLAISYIKGVPIFAERYLYISTAGFGMLVSTLLYSLSERLSSLRGPLIASLILVIITATFSVATVKRNIVWNSSIALWHDVVKKVPSNMTARLWYGRELIDLGRLDEAITTMEEGLLIAPNDDTADGLHNNLGIAYAKKGLIPEAASQFEAALLIDPGNKDARKNLDQAVKILRQGDGNGGDRR